MSTKPSNNIWLTATVEKITPESPMVKSFFFKMPYLLTHKAGQHYEVRLTAENGYQAARLYSAATAGDKSTLLHLAIMDVENGEVSPYLFNDLKEGDEVEIRGPFGKFFVWTPEETRPILLVGGGSGVVPMHAIIAEHETTHTATPMHLIYSTRRFEDILFKDAFLNADTVSISLTQKPPSDWQGLTGRINISMFEEVLKNIENPLCYICGMSQFVDAASAILLELGIPAKDIKTERFG